MGPGLEDASLLAGKGQELRSWTDFLRIAFLLNCYSEKPTTFILKFHVTLL